MIATGPDGAAEGSMLIVMALQWLADGLGILLPPVLPQHGPKPRTPPQGFRPVFGDM
jgi:hypothetical protein